MCVYVRFFHRCGIKRWCAIAVFADNWFSIQMELPDKLLIKCVKNSIWNIFFFLQIFTNSHVIAKWVSWAIQAEKQIVQRFWMTNSNCHNLTWITTILENVHLFKLVTLNNSIDSMEFYASALIFFQRHFKPDYALGYGFFSFLNYVISFPWIWN